jgi:membrane protease YdiL (CAAX protease family)
MWGNMSTISDEAVTPIEAQATATAADADNGGRSANGVRMPGLRLLFRGFLWCLAAMIAAGVAGFMAGTTLGVTGAKFGLTPVHLKTIYFICGLVAAGITLLYAAQRNGLALGRGDLRAGLGDGPVRRLWLVILLAVIVALYGSFVSYAGFLLPGALENVAAAGWMLNVVVVILAILLAPLAEERFFRGWFWTALKQHWGVLPVAIATSLLWLALHLPDGLGKVVALIPVAVCIVLARRYCDTVSASLAVHVVYNIFAIGTPLMMLLLR